MNSGTHKSLIGRYFAPVACLNDPETFLGTLTRREFACGLAESIKIAILKSPRLFEVIDRYHRDVEYSPYTHELIHISIRMMLEELQPNLYEQNLCRLADFGHEFGHIIEARAHHEIPHGECVAVGIAISSFLAYMKGVLARSNLEKILSCIINQGLPIYMTGHDSCNSEALWKKISTDGIDHKDEMLYLAVPEVIGRGTFIKNIEDINVEMVKEAILRLRQYAKGQTEFWCHPPARNGLTFGTGSSSLSGINSSLSNGKTLDSKEGQFRSSGNSFLSNGGPPSTARKRTFAIIGASGDIRS